MLMLTVNLISIVMILLLSPYEEAYAFRMVNMVTLIYLDVCWLTAGIVNPGIITKSRADQYSCIACKEDLQDENIVNAEGHCR